MIITSIAFAALPILLPSQQYFYLNTTSDIDTTVVDSQAYKCVNDITFITAPMQRQCFIERVRIDTSFGPGLLTYAKARTRRIAQGFTSAQVSAELAGIFVERSDPPIRVEYASGKMLTVKQQQQHLNTVAGDTGIVPIGALAKRAACIATCPGYI